MEKCDGADQAGLAGHMSLLDLVQAVLHLTSPPNSSPSHPDLSGVAAAATSAASACGFSSLPLAAGEKLLAGVVLSERAMVQGGVGSFFAAMQLQRLQKQRSSAFAVIRAFYPLAPPDALDGRRLHIAFASKDLGFSSVGQLVLRAIPACKKYVWLYCDLVHLCADQWSARVAVVALTACFYSFLLQHHAISCSALLLPLIMKELPVTHISSCANVLVNLFNNKW